MRLLHQLGPPPGPSPQGGGDTSEGAAIVLWRCTQLVPRWCFVEAGAHPCALGSRCLSLPPHSRLARAWRYRAGGRRFRSIRLIPIRPGTTRRRIPYYDLPPYAAIKPGFYHWRYFMMAQERNRYRYMPHIFRGYTDATNSRGAVDRGNSPRHGPEPISYPDAATQARDRL